MEPTINTDPTPNPTPDQLPTPGADGMNNIASPDSGTFGVPGAPAMNGGVAPGVGGANIPPAPSMTPPAPGMTPPVAPNMGGMPSPGIAAPGPNPMAASATMQPSPASQFAGSMQMNQFVVSPTNGGGIAGGAPVSPALSAAGMLNDTEPITMPTPPKAPDPVEVELKAPIKAAAPVPGSIGSAISVPGDPNGAVGTEFANSPAMGANNPMAPKKKSFFSGLFGRRQK